MGTAAERADRTPLFNAAEAAGQAAGGLARRLGPSQGPGGGEGQQATTVTAVSRLRNADLDIVNGSHADGLRRSSRGTR